MILSFKHKGIEKFYTSGSKAGIQPEHTEAQHHSSVSDSRKGAERYGSRRLGTASVEGRDGGTLVGKGEWKLASDVSIYGHGR
jgi:hypothetical protein